MSLWFARETNDVLHITQASRKYIAKTNYAGYDLFSNTQQRDIGTWEAQFNIF